MRILTFIQKLFKKNKISIESIPGYPPEAMDTIMKTFTTGKPHYWQEEMDEPVEVGTGRIKTDV